MGQIPVYPAKHRGCVLVSYSQEMGYIQYDPAIIHPKMDVLRGEISVHVICDQKYGWKAALTKDLQKTYTKSGSSELPRDPFRVVFVTSFRGDK